MIIFNAINYSQVNKLLIETNKDINSSHINSDRIDHYINKNSKSVIFLFIDNYKESILFYYELIKSENVPIILSPDLDDKSISVLLSKYKPNYILSLRKINFIKNKFLHIKNFNKYFLYEEKIKNLHYPHKDLCLLMSTSGSTGSPKLVKLSYENINHNSNSICKFLKIKNNDTTITTLQPNYTYGLSIINTHINMNAKIILNRNSFFEKNFWEKCKKFKVNSFGAVSFMYEILKKLRFEKMDLPHIKYLTHAGGKLNNLIHNDILQMCEKNKIKFISMYGQTEATSRISFLPWKFSKKKISSIGKAIPGGEIFFMKNKYKGEICYKGKNIMIGYANNYKDLKTKEVIKTLYTGDFGWKDKDGFFYIEGRKDRYIKNFGHRINLDEIDNYLHECGYKTATIYKDNKFLIFYENNYDFNEIKKELLNKFNINQKNIKDKKIDQIPTTNSGKIKYSKLK